MRTDTNTLIEAGRILARDIQSEDGVANGAVSEMAERLAEQQAEIQRLQAIVDKLPKTADGVPTVPSNSTRLWYVHPYSGTVYERTYEVDLDDARSHRSHVRDERTEVTWISVRECYSTREAAEKAREQ